MSTGSPRPLVCAAAGVLLLTACGSTVDVDQLEEDIRTQVEQAGEVVESVECPDQINDEQGNSFRCELTDPDGETRTVEGQFTDSEGNFDLDLDVNSG